jgi:dipeptidase E
MRTWGSPVRVIRGRACLPLYTREVGGQIVAMGGGGFFSDGRSPLDDFILSLSAVERPRICFVPTPSGDSDQGIAAFFEAFSTRDCEPSCLRLFGSPDDPVTHLSTQDVIYVCGGNTANALAIWRVHGVDVALRDAWERGAVLGGPSAGANCWFECSVTDSFGRDLAPLHDGLGLLPGSFCPHYDGEEFRRPRYRALVDEGFPPGYAADDDAALHFVGTELREVVRAREGPAGYRVEPGVEMPMEARALTTAS